MSVVGTFLSIMVPYNCWIHTPDAKSNDFSIFFLVVCNAISISGSTVDCMKLIFPYLQQWQN